MAGRGKVKKEDTTPHPRVFALNTDDHWVAAVEPLHFDKPNAGVGPGLAFGKTLADALKDATIGLIPCAAGGSPIRVWKKDAYWGQTKSKPDDETLRRLYRFAGMPPSNAPEIFACPGMVVGLYGIRSLEVTRAGAVAPCALVYGLQKIPIQDGRSHPGGWGLRDVRRGRPAESGGRPGPRR